MYEKHFHLSFFLVILNALKKEKENYFMLEISYHNDQ